MDYPNSNNSKFDKNYSQAARLMVSAAYKPANAVLLREKQYTMNDKFKRTKLSIEQSYL